MEMFKRTIRTDMADESRVGAGSQVRGLMDSVKVCAERDGDEEVHITRVHVDTPEGEQRLANLLVYHNGYPRNLTKEP